jgi:S-adenosylmethionine synthetase
VRSTELLWAACCVCLQVTIEYLRDGGHLEPLRVHTLLISTQHSPDVSLLEVQDELMKHVITPVIPQRLLTPDTQYFLNPSKR